MWRHFIIFAVVAALTAAGRLPGLPWTRNLPFKGLEHRVVGGEIVDIREYPHQISMQTKNGHACGGSIISKNWIVTAGHCFYFFTPHEYTIQAGSGVILKGGSRHTVKRAIMHEKFNMNEVMGVATYDIALAEVNEPFKLDETRVPIGLFKANEESVPGIAAIVSGFGETNGKDTDYLHAVTLEIVSKKVCNLANIKMGGIGPDQICAGHHKGGKSACFGDSGGPLTIGGRLAGLVSWGFICGSKDYPTVYTEIAKHRDWIRERSGV